MSYLITGAAGFIGFNLCMKLLLRGDRVIGLDNLNDYYDVNLKKARLAILEKYENFSFIKGDLADLDCLKNIFHDHKPTHVCNLAAQAGVRYSLINPFAYEESNLKGFLNIMHLSKEFNVENFVYASSSSVYGNNKKTPFSVDDTVDTPISIYAATKKANELMAHTYSHLYDLNTTGLRFFTVYGPWGRPDMALFLFTRAILSGEPIKVFNYGKMQRDFTYIDDIIQGVVASLDTPFKYEIFNIGNSQTVELETYINCIEEELGIKAKRELLPMQPGDVPATSADIEKTTRMLGFKPTTNVRQGIKKFIKWYREYYKV